MILLIFDPFTLIPNLIAGFFGMQGAAAQRRQSLADIQAQNAYNHPAAQLGRLRSAGLPFAAFESGQAGNQSALPATNDEGYVNMGAQIAQFMQTNIQKKQLEILEQELRTKDAEADVKEHERDWLLFDNPNFVTNDYGWEGGPSNLIRMKAAQMKQQETQSWINENEWAVSNADKELRDWMKEHKIYEGQSILQIQSMLNQNKQFDELFKRLEAETRNSLLVSDMQYKLAKSLSEGKMPKLTDMIFGLLYQSQGGPNVSGFTNLFPGGQLIGGIGNAFRKAPIQNRTYTTNNMFDSQNFYKN